MSDTDRFYYFTFGLAIAALIGILISGLLPAVLSGLLFFFLVQGGGNLISRAKVSVPTGRIIFLFLLVFLIVGLFTRGIIVSTFYLTDGSESFVELFQRMADVVGTVRDYLPAWALEYIPNSTKEWQEAIASWLRENAGRFSVFGQEVGMFLLHIVIGAIVGSMVALKPGFHRSRGPLAVALSERVKFIGEAFKRIVFSQIRISALNTVLTGIFLAGVLPLIGYDLPFTKTMIAVTFIVGLLPIIGNLISNTVIVLIALSVAPLAAIWSLTFLVLIHKLEYFVNAQIIGIRIKARAWELLLAMLVMETMFGLPGLVAAPIYYSYLKDELSSKKLI